MIDHRSPKYWGAIRGEQPDPLQHTESPGLTPAPECDQPTLLPLTLEEARLKLKLEPNMTLSQDPDGKIVIQELDSPVTRREKAMRRKQARSRLSAPAITANSELDGSDLSSLSELSEDQDGSVCVTKTLNETKTRAAPGEVILEDRKMLDGGTLGETITSFPLNLNSNVRGELQSGRKPVCSILIIILHCHIFHLIFRELSVVGCCHF